MTRKVYFVDAFWDDEFCGVTGYETILKKLKDGRQMCKDWEHFIKERARIEEEYGNKLLRLSKTPGGATAMGSISTSWEMVRSRTEAIANEHLLASKEMSKATERMTDLLHSEKIKRLNMEQIVTKSAKAKKELYNKVLESKKSFHTKSVEADQIEKNVNAIKAENRVQQNLKEWEKLLVKSQKTKQDASKADKLYKDLLDQLEKARQQWENDMVQTCKEFDSLENERLLYLRNEMWIHTNIISQTAVDDDQHCEEIRLMLEKCDIEKDLTDFIEKRRTGSRRPAKIEYEGWNAAPQKKQSSFDRPPQPLPGMKSHKLGAL